MNKNKQSFTLGSIASRFDLKLKGDSNLHVSSVASLQNATTGQLSFLSNSKFIQHLKNTSASVVILNEEQSSNYDSDCLIADDPYVSYAQVATLFESPARHYAGHHPQATIHETAQVDSSASIDAGVVIGPDCVIGPGCIIGAGSVIGHSCTLDKQSTLQANVTLYPNVQLGKRVIIHSGAVLGADGFGLAYNKDHWIKVPQLGRVIIGDDCEIGANTTIDRGALDDTILEEGVRLDNLIQVAHGVYIGAHTVVAGCTGISGSVKIGKYCMIGGGVGFSGHFSVTDHVTVTGMSLVSSSINTPGVYSSGTALSSNADWRKNAARFRQLDKMHKRMIQMEKEIKKLKEEPFNQK